MRALMAEWASPARVRFAYPGLWLREDVYATHGHYLDCHLTVPTVERGLWLVAFCSMLIAGDRPSIMSTSGLSMSCRNWRA